MRYQLNKFVIQLLRRDGDCGQMHEVACACLFKMIIFGENGKGTHSYLPMYLYIQACAEKRSCLLSTSQAHQGRTFSQLGDLSFARLCTAIAQAAVVTREPSLLILSECLLVPSA